MMARTSRTPDFPPPPSSLLADGVVELCLLRVMGSHNAAARSANERFIAEVPEYRFAIHRLNDGLRVGRIHIRVTNDNEIVDTIGHSGYAVNETHRRRGYATRALRLVVGLAEYWKVMPLWIFIEPDNEASRRTVGRVGFELVDVIDSPAKLTSLGIGSKVCRYRCTGSSRAEDERLNQRG